MSLLKEILIKAGKLKADFIEKIRSGQIKMIDSTINVKLNIKGGSGLIDLIKTSVLKAVGLTDFMNAKLDENLNFVADMIKVEVGDHATETNPVKIIYSSAKANAKVALHHAKLVLKQDGVILFSEQIANLMEDGKKEGANGQIGYMIENPFVIAEQSEVKAELVFPEGVTMPTDKEYFISLTLGGEKTALN